MKTAEAHKSTTSQSQIQAKRQPFFNKEGEGGFFSKSAEKTTPFFNKNIPFVKGEQGGIQPKLTIGKPNDKYEVEADAMADKVVQRLSDPKSNSPLEGSKGDVSQTFSPPIQTKCATCEEKEKLQKKEDDEVSESDSEVQRKPIFESNAEQPEANVQTKLLNSPLEGGKGDVFNYSGQGAVQTKCATCEQEEKLQKKEEDEVSESEDEVQAKDINSPFGGQGALQSRLSSSKGGGSPLPSDIQTSMGSAFEADFSGVRVHTGSDSVQMNKELGAQAFTNGSDIYFNQGKFDTNSDSGKHLLAHELTHTVQQNAISDQENNAREPKKGLFNDANIETSSRNQNSEKLSNKNQESPLTRESQSGIRNKTSSLQNKTYEKQSVVNKSNAEVKEAKNSTKESLSKRTTSENSNIEKIQNGAVSNSESQSLVQEQISSGITGTEGSGNNAILPAPELNAESSTGLLNSLSASSPTGFLQGMQEAKSLVPQIQQNENDELVNSLPEITQPTGLPITTVENESLNIITETEEVEIPEAQNVEGPLQIEESHEQVEGNVNVANVPTPRANTEEDQNFTENIRNATASLPTSDPTINTSAGEQPSINLTGEANPRRNEESQQLASENVANQQNQADSNISNDFGEHNIFPRYTELEQLRPELSERQSAASGASELESLPETSAEVYASFDNQAQSSMNEQVGAEMLRNEEERERMNLESENERARGMEEIEQETERTRVEQEAIQAGARNEVAEHRETWREENQAVRDEYSQRSIERRTEIDTQIDSEIITAETQVETELTAAEGRAETERQNAETEARRRKANAEREQESQGFWDRVTSAVSSFFDRLKEGLNALFDAAREAVANIIEAAKTIVNTIIDTARNLIVGLIEGFGEFLKGLVNIALAAFPEIAERINGWINQAVDVAVSAVNALADALKEIANAILDAVGAILDFILAAYQAFYNALLDVLEFIAVGLIEIIKGIANIVKAAYLMPNYFMGQMSEELLGFDLTQPLAGIERSGSEGSAINVNGQEASVPIENERLLRNSQLSNEDVMVDPVSELQLDPELITSLGLSENGEVRFGEPGGNDISTLEIQESIIGSSTGGTDAGFQEQLGAQQPEGGEAPDFANITDNEKLSHYLSEMDEPQCEDAPPQQSGGQTEEVPDIAKVGPLTVAQRADFVLGQMQRGISNWWECNKVMIISISVGVLLGLGIATILTGGGILSLLPPLMTALMYLFMAWLVARMSGYMGEYLSKAWSGDIQGGAKSLARALAVGIVELVFNLVFKVGGIMLKVIRRVISTVGRAARAVGRGAMRAGRAIAGGVRRGARAIGNVARGAGGFIVRGGRVIFQGVRRGFGRGIRSLRDLGNRLKRYFRFRGFSLDMEGTRYFLYGHFNPRKILIGSGNVRDLTELQEQALRQQGGKIIGRTFRASGQDAIVVTSKYARRFRRMSPIDKAVELQTLQGLRNSQSNIIRHIGYRPSDSRHIRVFLRAFPKFRKFAGKGIMEIHHRIPQVFFREGKFSLNLMNRLSNLQALPVNIHRRIVTPAWEAFRRSNPNASAREIIDFAIRMDKRIGQYINKIGR